MQRNLLIAISAITLLALSCKRVKSKDSVKHPQRVKYAVAESVRSITREFAGLSTPDDAVTLAFKIGGEVMELPVSKGEFIRRGEIIAELDPHEVELEVESNRTAYEEATSQLQRMQRLLSHEAISIQEYEAAKTRYAQSKSKYENSLSLLQDTKIRAPYDGVIERTYVDTYQRVASGEPIARLVNPISTTVSFTMPENLIYLLEQSETHFSVKFDNFPNQIFKARLKNFARTSADASGFPTSLTIEHSDSSHYAIAPGISCMIIMQSRDSIDSAVKLPLSAIYAPATGEEFVWVIDSTSRVKLTRIKLGGLSINNQAIIDSGLKSGEKVVTAGVYRLRDGQRVEILTK